MEPIKQAIIDVTLRADKGEDDALINSFVEVGSVIPLLKSKNDYVLYGRRGSGKTHVLKYLQHKLTEEGDICLYIDLRTIGSSASLYADSSIPFSQRTNRLMIDVVTEISNQLAAQINYLLPDNVNTFQKLNDLLNAFPQAWTEEVYSQNIRVEESTNYDSSSGTSTAIKLSPNPEINFSHSNNNVENSGKRVSREGSPVISIKINLLMNLLDQFTDVIDRRIRILFDEYSVIPEELQPQLADMIRRTLSPLKSVNFVIGAIEHRSTFKIVNSSSHYLGLELGADASTINLDNILVFGNNQSNSIIFFKDLLLKHINSVLPPESHYKNSDEIIRDLFTSDNTFIELVLAAEGVPRDFLSVLRKTIEHKPSGKIEVQDIRNAAREWYVQDKHTSVTGHDLALRLLNWIIDKVIKGRKAKGFMLEQGKKDQLIIYLFDNRLLHIIKQGSSAKDQPGMRFDCYAIDYGCYVELINTANKPKCLFEDEDLNVEVIPIEVPRDDYRSLRRSILNLDEFYESMEKRKEE